MTAWDPGAAALRRPGAHVQLRELGAHRVCASAAAARARAGSPSSCRRLKRKSIRPRGAAAAATAAAAASAARAAAARLPAACACALASAAAQGTHLRGASCQHAPALLLARIKSVAGRRRACARLASCARARRGAPQRVVPACLVTLGRRAPRRLPRQRPAVPCGGGCLALSPARVRAGGRRGRLRRGGHCVHLRRANVSAQHWPHCLHDG